MQMLNIVKWLELTLDIETTCTNCGTKHTEAVTVETTGSQLSQESEDALEINRMKNSISQILHAAGSGCPWKTTRKELAKLLGQE